MSQVFVSHSKADQAVAEKVVGALVEAGLTPSHPASFTPGDHVIREVYIAGDHKKPFIVFQLDRTEFPDEMLYFISGFPRLSVDALDQQGLRTELSRLLVN